MGKAVQRQASLAGTAWPPCLPAALARRAHLGGGSFKVSSSHPPQAPAQAWARCPEKPGLGVSGSHSGASFRDGVTAGLRLSLHFSWGLIPRDPVCHLVWRVILMELKRITAFKTGDNMDEVGASRAAARSPDHWGIPSGLPQRKTSLGSEPRGSCLNLARPCKQLLTGDPGGHL